MISQEIGRTVILRSGITITQPGVPAAPAPAQSRAPSQAVDSAGSSQRLVSETRKRYTCSHLILYQFGNLSIVAPLANVALLPLVPTAMLLGALALVGGLVYLPLGQGLATIAYLFLTWLAEGARLFARLPWAAMQLPPFPLRVLLKY
jgi:hypothetical protein